MKRRGPVTPDPWFQVSDRIKRVAREIIDRRRAADRRSCSSAAADETRTTRALSHSCGDGRGARGVALLDILCTAVPDARRLRLSAEVVQRHHRLE